MKQLKCISSFPWIILYYGTYSLEDLNNSFNNFIISRILQQDYPVSFPFKKLFCPLIFSNLYVLSGSWCLQDSPVTIPEWCCPSGARTTPPSPTYAGSTRCPTSPRGSGSVSSRDSSPTCKCTTRRRRSARPGSTGGCVGQRGTTIVPMPPRSVNLTKRCRCIVVLVFANSNTQITLMFKKCMDFTKNSNPQASLQAIEQKFCFPLENHNLHNVPVSSSKK